MALTYNQVFEHEIRELVAAELEQTVENLAAGLAAKDYADYRYSVGKIAGLRRIAELCDIASQKLSER